MLLLKEHTYFNQQQNINGEQNRVQWTYLEDRFGLKYNSLIISVKDENFFFTEYSQTFLIGYEQFRG